MITQGTAHTLMFIAVDASSPTLRLTSSIAWSPGDTLICKPGAAPANTTNAPTHLGSGFYSLVLTSTETNLGLAAGESGQIIIAISNVLMVPFLGIMYEVTSVAPGALTSTERTAIATETTTATAAIDIDGTPLDEAFAIMRSALVGKGVFPMTASGGAFATRDAADTKNRWAGTIAADGTRLVTTSDGS